MYETFANSLIENQSFSITEFNNFNSAVHQWVQRLYANGLDVNFKLDRLVKFKKSQMDFYKQRIDDVLNTFNAALTRENQRIVEIPLSHMHFVDQAKTTANVDISTRKITINDTDASYRIKAEDLLTENSINFSVIPPPSIDSHFVESGSEIRNIFINYYNYYRYIVRTKANEPCALEIAFTFPEEQYVASIKLFLDNITRYVDKIKVYISRANYGVTDKLVYDDFIPFKTFVASVNETVSSITVVITKNTSDNLEFENGKAYFEYFFTLRKIEFYNKQYYRQNIFVSKPVGVGDPILGWSRTTAKFQIEASVPAETDIKYYYINVKRGAAGELMPIAWDKMQIIRPKDTINFVEFDRKVLASDVMIYRLHNSNYAYLKASVHVPSILNGGIYVFRGQGKTSQIGQSTTGQTTAVRFWVINIGTTDLDVNLSDYVTKCYVDTKLVDANSVKVGMGFYKFVVETDDIDTFLEYLDTFENLYVARDKLSFGLPSELFSVTFTHAFTLMMDEARIMAGILVSLPTDLDELQDRYLILYDTRKKS